MNWMTRKIWEAMVDPSSIRFFQHLLEDTTGPDIGEVLKEYFLEEVEKISFDEDTPGLLSSVFVEVWELADFDLLAERWERLGDS